MRPRRSFLLLLLRSRLAAFLPIGEVENKCGRGKEGRGGIMGRKGGRRRDDRVSGSGSFLIGQQGYRSTDVMIVLCVLAAFGKYITDATERGTGVEAGADGGR